MNVILLMAQTVDGKVAHHRDELIDWTTREDKKFFVSETKRVGTIIMGRTTYATFGRPLPGRTIIVMTRNPGEPIEANDGRVVFTSDAPRTIIEKLEAEGKTEVILAGGPTVNALFLKENLITEIKLSIEPRLFGTGLSLFEGSSVNQPLELLSVTHLTPQVIVLHYRVVTDNR